MEHFYHTVPGWFGSEDAELYSLAVATAPDTAHFVEIGSWKGQSAAFMAVEIVNSGKRIQFDCVDTWLGSEEHLAGGFAQDIDAINGQLYQAFEQNMRPVQEHYRALRMTSLEAAKLYPDQSLDFVFIDAAHDYDSVHADIQAWYPKVRSGGILSGDDLPCPAVAEAIVDLLPAMGYHKLIRIGKTWHIVKK